MAQDWGKPVPVSTEGAWGKPVPVEPQKPDMTASLRSMGDMLTAPIDTSTGKPFKMNLPHPPKGTLPVLAGMATAIGTGGLSVPEQVAAALLAGTSGSGAESLMRGEKPSLGNMAMEGSEQAAIAGLPWIGKGMASVGDRLAGVIPAAEDAFSVPLHAAEGAAKRAIGFRAGPVTKAAVGAVAAGVAHAAGLPSIIEDLGAGALASKYATPVVESAVRTGGRGLQSSGNAIEQAAMKQTTSDVLPQRFGPSTTVYEKAKEVPVIGDTMRKIQLLYRLLTNQQDEK